MSGLDRGRCGIDGDDLRFADAGESKSSALRGRGRLRLRRRRGRLGGDRRGIGLRHRERRRQRERRAGRRFRLLWCDGALFRPIDLRLLHGRHPVGRARRGQAITLAGSDQHVALGGGETVAFVGGDAIALEPAVDHRGGWRRRVRRAFIEDALADRAGDLRIVGVETRQGVAQWRRARRADRTRYVQVGGLDDAERGGALRLLRRLAGHRLTRDQRGEVLVSDLARQ